MLTENEYLMVWGFYLVAVLCLGLVWYRLVKMLNWRWLRNILLVLFFALMATPIAVVDNSQRMAPAAMTWLLESTILKADSLHRVYLSLGVAAFVGLLLVLAEAFWSYKRRGHAMLTEKSPRSPKKQ